MEDFSKKFMERISLTGSTLLLGLSLAGCGDKDEATAQQTDNYENQVNRVLSGDRSPPVFVFQEKYSQNAAPVDRPEVELAIGRVTAPPQMTQQPQQQAGQPQPAVQQPQRQAGQLQQAAQQPQRQIGQPQPAVQQTVRPQQPALPSAVVVNVKSDDTLNVRERAGTAHAILEKLPPGTRVSLTGERKRTKDGQSWRMIVTEQGTSGWVNDFYIQLR